MLALLLFTLTAHADARHCFLQPSDVVRASQPVANAGLRRLRAFAARRFPGSRLRIGAVSVLDDSAVYPATLLTRDGRTLVVTGFAVPVDVRDTGYLSRCLVRAADPAVFHLPVTFVDRAGRVEATMVFGTFSPPAFRDFGPHGCLENCPLNDDGSPGICSPVDMCDQSSANETEQQ